MNVDFRYFGLVLGAGILDQRRPATLLSFDVSDRDSYSLFVKGSLALYPFLSFLIYLSASAYLHV